MTWRAAPAGPAGIRWLSRREVRQVTRRAALAETEAIRCLSRRRRWRVTRRALAAGAGGDLVVVAAGGAAVASAGGAGGDPVVVAAGVKGCQAGARYVRAAGVGQSYCITVATVAFQCHLDCI